MAQLEDKKKAEMFQEIDRSRAFLVSLFDDVEGLLGQYRSVLQPQTFQLESEREHIEMSEVDHKMGTFNRKYGEIVEKLKENKDRLLKKIEENENWIENPMNKVEFSYRKNIAEGALISKINRDIRALKGKEVSEES